MILRLIIYSPMQIIYEKKKMLFLRQDILENTTEVKLKFKTNSFTKLKKQFFFLL